MTVETFFANFGHLADASNGVQKLREIVLGLAVRGKLTARKDSDTSVAQVLNGLNDSKQKLVKQKVIRDKEVDFPTPILEEFDIPEAWKWVRIAQICYLQTGATPSRQKTEYFGGDIKWLVSGDIHKGEIVDCDGRITESGMASSNCKLLPEDSVMIALNGQGKTRATVALLRVPAACNQSLVSITPFDNKLVLPEYVFQSLRYRYYEIRDVTGQKQRRGLNMKLVGELSISLPPLEEQKRIVAKVDQFMALCDELEARQQKQQQGRVRLNNAALDALLTAREPDEFADHWQRISTNFDLLYDHPDTIAKLRAAILQLAVQGKLAPQDPNDEPASVLLERITAEKGRKEKGIKGVSDADKPFSLPKSWSWQRLGCLVNITSSKRIFASDYVSNGVPFFRSKEIGELSRNGLTKDTLYISEEKFKGIKEHFGVPGEGDMLLTSVGSIGNTWIADGRDFYYKDGNITQICKSESLDMRFIQSFIGSPFFFKQIFKSVSGTAYNALTIIKIKNLIFPLPPLEEQKRIVAKIDLLMALCDELEAKLNQAQQHSEKLMEATVRQLLGSSTPQKPHVAKPARLVPEPKPVPKATAKLEAALPLVAEPPATYTGNVPQAILAHMQPGTEYARADITAALALSTPDWNWAIRQLKEQGRVVQTGERRGARYRRCEKGERR